MAKKYARTAGDITEADRLIEYIDRKPEEERPRPVRTARTDPAQSEAEQEILPPLPPQVEEAGQLPPPADLSQVRGVLQTIDCLGKEARVNVLVEGKQVSLLIRDPAGVYLRNSDESAVNMTCGPQHGTQVVLGFRPQEDTKFKTSGDVITLEFTTRPVRR
jgi:hypothetical protein